MQVTKAVIPVAGLGTRFLPASKSIPKEMAAVVDRPAIDYVVQEAVAAGIKQIVLVTHSAKTSIEDYFTVNYELEDVLAKKNKLELLEQINNLVPADVDIVAVRQGKALGLGHAVWCAKSVIGEQPFAVLLPDVLIDDAKGNDLANMLEQFTQQQQAQIMVEAVAQELVNQYGIVDLAGVSLASADTAKIEAIIEKPALQNAPSNLAVVGRYVFPAQIFALLEQTTAGVGGEIQLTDAIAALLTKTTVNAYRMQNLSFDCGSKEGYLTAIMHYAAKHEKLKAHFANLVKQYSQ